MQFQGIVGAHIFREHRDRLEFHIGKQLPEQGIGNHLLDFIKCHIGVPSRRKVPGHIRHKIVGVFKFPGIGFVTQHGKLEGELLLILLDILVDPICEGLHAPQDIRIGLRNHLAGLLCEFQSPEEHICLYQSGIEYF